MLVALALYGSCDQLLSLRIFFPGVDVTEAHEKDAESSDDVVDCSAVPLWASRIPYGDGGVCTRPMSTSGRRAMLLRAGGRTTLRWAPSGGVTGGLAVNCSPSVNVLTPRSAPNPLGKW